MASEARELLDQLYAAGISQADIARGVGRSSRMIRKVQTGDSPGNNLVPALRQMARGERPTPPPRQVRPGEQMTPAGRVIQVTPRGARGLLQGLARDRLTSDRASIVIEYRDSRGRDRVGTLYAKGGRSRGAIVDDLDALGAEPDDPASIVDALAALIDSEGANDGGASGLGGVGSGTITSVTVSPA